MLSFFVPVFAYAPVCLVLLPRNNNNDNNKHKIRLVYDFTMYHIILFVAHVKVVAN